MIYQPKALQLVLFYSLLIYLYTTVCIQIFIQTYSIIDFVTVKILRNYIFGKMPIFIQMQVLFPIKNAL